MVELNSEIAWVTGASRGIGKAIACELAKRSARIAISSRTPADLVKTQGEIASDLGVTVLPVVCDVTSSESVSGAIDSIEKAFGKPVSILVNNAGIGTTKTFTETTIEEFDSVMAVNFKGAYLCTKAVLPAMYEAGRGTIVQLLSISSEKAFRGGAVYTASKFALKGFTDSLREEARGRGVRVIGLLPGATETEIWSQENRTQFHARMMQPEDIATALMSALELPNRALVEEIRMRPIGGDL